MEPKERLQDRSAIPLLIISTRTGKKPPAGRIFIGAIKTISEPSLKLSPPKILEARTERRVRKRRTRIFMLGV
ncbi:MAG: hypothetical protein ACJA1W_002379 [Akkermansiaceae bacterium]|jgi:hypothetical protein